MTVQPNENPPEPPLAVKLMKGYVEQLDLFGPAIVKAAQDYRDAGVSTVGLARRTLLSAVEQTGRKPPFINTLADAASGVVSLTLKFQCTAIEAGIKAQRQAVQAILDTMTGTKPT